MAIWENFLLWRREFMWAFQSCSVLKPEKMQQRLQYLSVKIQTFFLWLALKKFFFNCFFPVTFTLQIVQFKLFGFHNFEFSKFLILLKNFEARLSYCNFPDCCFALGGQLRKIFELFVILLRKYFPRVPLFRFLPISFGIEYEDVEVVISFWAYTSTAEFFSWTGSDWFGG